MVAWASGTITSHLASFRLNISWLFGLFSLVEPVLIFSSLLNNAGDLFPSVIKRGDLAICLIDKRYPRRDCVFICSLVREGLVGN
jgi:hypothetical protein